MAKNLFSVPIFFIVFRETLEAAIIISVLLGLVEQIVYGEPDISPTVTQTTSVEGQSKDEHGPSSIALSDPEDDLAHRRLLVRKLRIQIFAGSALGLLLALAIGAAYVSSYE
ncbi:hypothetical protein H0H87_006927 [Tephrocybe sp. NHM501043]|nr:hypothetical protein H0H87_006927 [Tephrocybe sp. NHM501043]